MGSYQPSDQRLLAGRGDMNILEHQMRHSGRTTDRMTIDYGWAGWHYRLPSLLRRLWIFLTRRQEVWR